MRARLETDVITIPPSLVKEIEARGKRPNEFIKESVLLWYADISFREKVEQCAKAVQPIPYNKNQLSSIKIGAIFKKYLHEIAGLNNITIPMLIECFLNARQGT